MLADRSLQVAFLLSLLIHGAVLVQWQNLKFSPLSKKEKQVEVRYIRRLGRTSTETAKEDSRLKAEPLLKLSSRLKITAERRSPPPFIEREDVVNKKISDSLQSPGIDKPTLARPDAVTLKKKVTLPAIGIEKINNPTYISYYQIVREKIKRAAYQNYNRGETGEVFLSFIISKDGELKDVRVLEEKSSSQAYLQQIALRSIKNASPFPPFPKELDYPRLSFNVIISFEIE
jgi:TonB family protein